MRFNLGEFLQSTRGRWALVSLIVSGLVSVALGLLFPNAEWGLPVQILLVLSFVLFVVLLYVPPDARLRILAGGFPLWARSCWGWWCFPSGWDFSSA
ncbi:MAG UNVERIFIED_CONTAM: hypothetical protein LVT10_01290 [Anaerolineae bacterium]|jgi:hypothetical protein